MNEEITDVKPPMGFPHITDLAGSEATILQVANSQGDILGYATLDDIDAYIEQKVSETVHSFSQKQIFQDVTIDGTIGGSGINALLSDYYNKQTVDSTFQKKIDHITRAYYFENKDYTIDDIINLLSETGDEISAYNWGWGNQKVITMGSLTFYTQNSNIRCLRRMSNNTAWQFGVYEVTCIPLRDTSDILKWKRYIVNVIVNEDRAVKSISAREIW